MTYKEFREADPVMQQVSQTIRETREWQEEQRRREDFHSYQVDITSQFSPSVAILSIEGVALGTEGNISTVVGEAKSKKTFFSTGLVGGLLNRNQQRVLGSDPRPETTVLWVDTEQSQTHVQLTARRIHFLAGLSAEANDDHFRMLALREIEPKLRTKMLFDAIAEWKPRLVVIDGISDLLYNTNDLEESEALVTTLMRTSSRLKNHILVVLHTNPNSDKARGHIGSALQRKSESVIYVRKVGECSIVEPQFCRNEPFDRFAFRITSQGLPECCPIPRELAGGQNPYEDVVRVVESAGEVMVNRKVVVTKLCEMSGYSENRARVRLSRAIRSGALVESSDGLLSIPPIH